MAAATGGEALRPCALCGHDAELVGEHDFHLSFAKYEGEIVQHNFLHYGAIQCSNCGLTLPFFGGDENRMDNINFWNGVEE